MSDNRPIGIFDSGLGGLSVVKQIIRILPNEDLLYLGDNARVPYGGRSKEIVTKFSFENANFLVRKKVKCIVVACNTSSALAGGELKRKLPVPVFDVISPATAEAKKETKSGRIGVIGTRGTIGSKAYPFKHAKACPLFVPFIEEGEVDTPALKIVARKYLEKFKKAKIDTLILGCTHYPIIKKIIEEEVDNNVKIIDPGISISYYLAAYLKKNNLMNSQKQRGRREYYVTDYNKRFVKVAEMFLGHKINHNLKRVELQS